MKITYNKIENLILLKQILIFNIILQEHLTL